jgi:hypothetical protein
VNLREWWKLQEDEKLSRDCDWCGQRSILWCIMEYVPGYAYTPYARSVVCNYCTASDRIDQSLYRRVEVPDAPT